jgi:hypothetical protein
MHPIEFRHKWQLSHAELALILGYQNPHAVRAWETRSSYKREPHQVVYIACRLLDEKWAVNGVEIRSYL